MTDILQTEGSLLRNEDFSRRSLSLFESRGSHFEDCSFDGIVIRRCCFGIGDKESHYIRCRFDRARIRFDMGQNARFVECSFRGVDLRDWFCFSLELIDCVFSGRLRKAFFNGTVPEFLTQEIGRERNEVTGNDFTAMSLEDVAFRTGIDLSQQRLPVGTRYLYIAHAEATLQQARKTLLEFDEGDDTRRAVQLIDSMIEYDLSGGQQQLFLQKDNYLSWGRRPVDLAFAVLKSAIQASGRDA